MKFSLLIYIYSYCCRILNVCKKYLAASTAAQDMAVYLTGVYITRPDVRDIHLTNFIQWILEVLTFFQASLLK